jgi:hypothetical protein
MDILRFERFELKAEKLFASERIPRLTSYRHW